jgi:hypothetical protein
MSLFAWSISIMATTVVGIVVVVVSAIVIPITLDL